MNPDDPTEGLPEQPLQSEQQESVQELKAALDAMARDLGWLKGK